MTMGDSPNRGVTQEIALASAVNRGLPVGYGAPATPARHAQPVTSSEQNSQEGNRGQIAQDALGESPALFVSVRFSVAGSLHTVHVPWRTGFTVSDACRAARQLNPLFKHVSPLSKARVIGKVRTRSLAHPMRPGDELRLNPPQRPFL